MGGGGGGGLEPPPPTMDVGGTEPPHITTCPYYNYNSKCLYVSTQAIISTPNRLSKCPRNTLRKSKFPKFSGGACSQTHLGGLWAYAHNTTVVTMHTQRSEHPSPPPTFVFTGYYL